VDENRSDGELLRASASEPEAFGLFYQRHVRVLLGFFYRRTACPETAADLTAETFAQAYVSRRRFRETSSPARAWLLGIARHQLSKALRKGRVEERARQRLGIQRVEVDELSYERIEALVDFEPVRQAVQAALGSLPQTLADAVSLRVGLDLPYSEVARRLGCSEQAARVRVSRGLTRLAETLEVRP
jgi:RNA polymerase sigma-70 factor (ECF subfamily)